MKQKLLQNQGMGARSAAVQGKFVRRWVGWLLFITFLALFYVWTRVQVVQLGYEITMLKREAEGILKQVSGLKLEIAKLKSPKRLEEVARQNLRMQPPSAEQIVLV